MRISERHRYWVANERVGHAREDHVNTLHELSTQKKINRLQDDPVGLTKSLLIKDNLHAIDVYKHNIDFAKGFLDISESSLSGIMDRLDRSYELAMTAANDTYDSSSRQATAMEVKEIINEIIQMGNAQYSGRFVFSGFRSEYPALARDGTFLGDDGEIFLQVGQDYHKPINLSGRALFQANDKEKAQGHFNLVDSASLLYDSLMANDKQGIYRSIEELKYQMDKTSSMQASLGATWRALEVAGKGLEMNEGLQTEIQSRIQDSDIYQATSDFKRAESVLQSTLMATNKLLQPSLMNFLQ